MIYACLSCCVMRLQKMIVIINFLFGWLGYFNVNWVFFQMYFLFSFQQRCKTVKLDFKPLRSGLVLTSTHKNWQMQVSTTEVLYVLFGNGAFTKYIGQILPILSPPNYPCLTFVQGSLTTNYVVCELALLL